MEVFVANNFSVYYFFPTVFRKICKKPFVSIYFNVFLVMLLNLGQLIVIIFCLLLIINLPECASTF